MRIRLFRAWTPWSTVCDLDRAGRAEHAGRAAPVARRCPADPGGRIDVGAGPTATKLRQVGFAPRFSGLPGAIAVAPAGFSGYRRAGPLQASRASRRTRRYPRMVASTLWHAPVSRAAALLRGGPSSAKRTLRDGVAVASRDWRRSVTSTPGRSLSRPMRAPFRNVCRGARRGWSR